MTDSCGKSASTHRVRIIRIRWTPISPLTRRKWSFGARTLSSQFANRSSATSSRHTSTRTSIAMNFPRESTPRSRTTCRKWRSSALSRFVVDRIFLRLKTPRIENSQNWSIGRAIRILATYHCDALFDSIRCSFLSMPRNSGIEQISDHRFRSAMFRSVTDRIRFSIFRSNSCT